MSERINVAPQAKDFKANGLPSSMRFPIPVDIEPDTPEALAFRSSFKPELYALTAVVIDYAVKKAYDERKPARDQIGKLEPTSPFISLGVNMRAAMNEVVERESRALEAMDGPEFVVQAFRRMDLLTRGIYEVLPDNINENGQRFIMGGINTANETMSGVLGVIPEVQGIDNTDDLIEIAENSFPLIMKLAAGHADVSINTIHSFRKIPELGFFGYTGFKKEFFTVKELNNKKYLGFTEAAEKIMAELQKDLDSYSTISDTVGCPAIVNFGDGSAVELLWKWYMEYAKEIYPRLNPAPKAK